LSCDALQVVGFREDENHYHYSEYDEDLCDGVLIRPKAGEFTKKMRHRGHEEQERLQRQQGLPAAEKKRTGPCNVSHSIRQDHRCLKGATQVGDPHHLGLKLRKLQSLKTQCASAKIRWI
jgi:hypothetical protein